MTEFASDIAETPEERRLKQDVGRLNDALAEEHDKLIKALAEIELLKELLKQAEDYMVCHVILHWRRHLIDSGVPITLVEESPDWKNTFGLPK